METIKINANDANQRIDKFVSKKYKTMPVSLIYKYIRQKDIKINGKKVKENDMLREGDVVTLYIPDEFVQKKSGDKFQLLSKLHVNIKVVYEDENIIICDKPAGVLVHSDDDSSHNTLIDHIQAYLFQKEQYKPYSENSFAPSLCNRIDRNTCGLVIAAKNAAALREMNEIIKLHELEKIYLAAVKGSFTQKKGRIENYLEKIPEKNLVVIRKSRTGSDVKEAITDYNVISYNKQLDISLLEIHLITGRTHQIRVQLANENHPLLGDGKYADNRNDRKKGFVHQALCSYRIKFKFKKQYSTLSYLNGKEVYAADPSFLDLFK